MISLKQTNIKQFLKFGTVGLTGLFVDTATVYNARHYIGLTCATILAYFVAATFNWFLNRLWTFRNSTNQTYFIIQWLRFLATNSLGFALNRGTVFSLFFASSYLKQHPFFALFAGAVAGMCANFNLALRLVYQNHPHKNGD